MNPGGGGMNPGPARPFLMFAGSPAGPGVPGFGDPFSGAEAGQDAGQQAQQANQLQNDDNFGFQSAGNYFGRVANAVILTGPTSPFGLVLETSASFDNASTSGGIFTASLNPSGTFSAPVNLGTTPAIIAFTQPFSSETFSGTSVAFPARDYILYELSNQMNTQKILAFAGIPTITLPTSGASFYDARDDFILGSKVFGIPEFDGGNLSISSTGPDAAIYWDNSLSANAQRPFSAISGGVSGTGSSQQMAFSVFVGQVNSSASTTLLQGNFVGFSLSSLQPLALFGGMFETSCNCNGSTRGAIEYGFYGENADHFILTSARSPGSSTILPFERRQGVLPDQTYNPAINFNSTTGTLSTRSTHLSSRSTGFNRQLTGWVAGSGVSVDKGSGFLTAFSFGSSTPDPNNVKIQTDPETNKVAASFTMAEQISGGDILFITLGDKDPSFGSSPALSGSSAFIDDKEFAANVECTSATCGTDVLFNSSPVQAGSFSITTLDEVPGLAGTYANCSYCTWGLIAGEIETDPGLNTFERVMGFWTAGAVQDLVDLPLSGTASYAGHMVAFVNYNGASYIEHGDATFSVNFAASASNGTLTVTNFDGGGLTGTFNSVASGGTGHSFNGSVTGTGALTGVSGSHDGSFYTDPAGNAVAGVGGSVTGQGTLADPSKGLYRLDGVHVQTCSAGACQ
jgi:hypothetical protein